jgi:predicted  nucleic acid-binding Zn-ribbon protein
MTTLNPSEATSLALNTLTSQIRNILLMPDGPAKAAIGSFETLLTANLTMISEAANAHINEFNVLVGELEARDSELLTQAILVSQLRQQVAEAEQRIAAARQEGAADLEAKAGELYKAQRALNDVQTKYGALQYATRQLERQLADLNAMDPAGMKRRIKEKNELLEEQRTAIAKHKSNEASYRAEVLKLGRRISELLSAINEQDRELERRHTIIMELESARAAKLIWHKHLGKTYKGEDGTLWDVYMVDHGLKSNLPYLINDLSWKLHAMKSDGSGCSVMLSQWMNPIYPAPHGSGAPDAMTQDIFAFMQEALEQSHPHLQPRTEWAKTVSIHECGLPPRTIKPLEEAGIDTLYKVMSHQGNKLDKVKGIGAKLVGQIVYACELKVKLWEEKFAAGQHAEQHKEAA